MLVLHLFHKSEDKFHELPAEVSLTKKGISFTDSAGYSDIIDSTAERVTEEKPEESTNKKQFMFSSNVSSFLHDS